jgi:hypothetical protein
MEGKMEDQTTFEVYDKIHALEFQVNALEKQVRQQDTLIQSFKTSAAGLPLTNLLSHSFLIRAFAVWGHYFAAQLIIVAILWVASLCLSLLITGSILSAWR